MSSEHKKLYLFVGGIITLFLTFILVFAWGMYTLVGATSYKKETPSLQTTAHVYFDTFTQKQRVGTPVEEISQQQNFSFGLQYPKLGDAVIDAQILDIKNQLKQDFITQYQQMTSEQIANRMKADETYTLLLSYESFQTEDDIVSIAFEDLYQTSDASTTFSHWHTYMFDMKQHKQLQSSDIFRDDTYRDIASSYAISYVENDTNINQALYPYYKESLAPQSYIFDTFTLKDESIIFYVDQFELLPAQYGALKIEMPRSIFNGCYVTDALPEPIPQTEITQPTTEQEEITQEAVEEITQESTQEIAEESKQEQQTRVIDPTKKMVALTFDDGPSPDATNDILDTLEQYGVVATFYDVGYRVERYPEVVQREAALGCEIGNHSYDHKNFAKLTAAQIQQDYKKTTAAFTNAGVTATSFRPPYGSLNDTVKANMPLPIATWSVDTLDWKTRNTASILKEVRNAGDLNGKVLLFHGIYDTTAAAIDVLVPELLEQGYQLVTVSELITYGHQEQPQNGKLYGYSYFQ